MDIRDRVSLKQRAGERLAAASYDPQKLTLLHGAVVVGVSLVLSLLTMALSRGIEGTGGLSGMGTRNLLETVQTLLSYAFNLLLPFWQIGIIFSFLRIIRSQPVGPDSLLRGFRRFGPVLRLKLMELVLYFAIAMICAYLSSFLAMTLSSKLYTLLEPLAMAMLEDPYADVNALMTQLPQQELMAAMLPVLMIFAGLYLAIVILVGYRLRFAQYLVVDTPELGAIASIRGSLQLTKKNCIALFRLDLSYWWYYLLQAVAVLACYADLFLKAAGAALPLSGQWATLVCYCVYGAMTLTLDYFCRPQVEATYALAYDVLKNPPLLRAEEIV